MAIPIEITFRGMEQSDALEDAVRERVDQLERLGPVQRCNVVIEVPHRHHRQGRLFHVRVRLRLRGAELVVRRGPAQHHAHEDPYVAVRDAFDSARRQLEDKVRERRGFVKVHEPPSQGKVVRLRPDIDCGFIAADDGREIYFHRNSVLGDGYDRIEEGTRVRYVEEPGEEGPQASTVRPIRRARRASEAGQPST